MPDRLKPVQPELVVAAPVEEEPMTEEDLWKEKTLKKEIEILRSQTEEVIYSRFKNMKRAFQHIDIDGSGKVDMSEYIMWSLRDALIRSSQRVLDLFEECPERFWHALHVVARKWLCQKP